MRFIPAILIILIVTGCASSGPVPAPQMIGAPESYTAVPGKASLALNGIEHDGVYELELQATAAADLYQVAGSLAFDASRYEVISVAAGGGLGEPEATYFAHSQREPGKLDFGYTKRFRGPGISASALLLRVKLEPQGEFELSDFTLLTGEGQLVARDSRKHELEVSVVAGGLQ